MTHVYSPNADKSDSKSPTFSTPQQTEQAQAAAGASPKDRYHTIAEAAYRRAEHRGFLPGYELQDWLEAEAEVDKPLTPVSAHHVRP